MCIGNTTSPAANNTTNVSWGSDPGHSPWESREAWERDQRTPQERAMHPPGSRNEDGSYGWSTPRTRAAARNKSKDQLKTPKSQSSKTSGGTY